MIKTTSKCTYTLLIVNIFIFSICEWAGGYPRPINEMTDSLWEAPEGTFYSVEIKPDIDVSDLVYSK